jgi:trypsin
MTRLNVFVVWRAGDTCQGDSGGPLMNDGAGVQVGITSFGIDCASGIPAIYTNVAAYQPFIEGIVKDLPPQ